MDVDRRTVLIVAILTSFIVPFMVSSVNIALPSIGKEFEVNAILLGWITTAYIIASAMFTVPFGRLADIYGRRKFFILGLLGYALSSFLCAFPSSPYLLIVFRVLQGIAGSMIFATNIAILTSVYPPVERGRVLGLSVSSTYAGLSLGPFLGGYLTYCMGWRSIFLIGALLSSLLALLAFRKIRREWSEAKGESFDLLGFGLYAGLIVCLMYGFSHVLSGSGKMLLLAGLLMLLLFFWWESKVKDPMLDVSLLKSNRVFTFSSLAALIHYSATFAVTFLLSLYLQYIKGLDPHFAGLVLLFQPLMMSILSPFAGKLSDRVEPRIIASSGMAITAIGLFLLSFIGKDTETKFVISSLVVLGIGFAFFSSPNTSAIMGSVERKLYGVASGMVATMRFLGQMLSMGIVMLIFSLYIGRSQIGPDNYSQFLLSLRQSFLIFTGLCLLAILASLARGNLRVAEGGECDEG